MNNITWSKSMGNWALNKDLEDYDKNTVEDLKEVLPVEAINEAKQELIAHCKELLDNSEKLYSMKSSKELHDAIISLGIAYKSLNNIFLQEIAKLN